MNNNKVIKPIIYFSVLFKPSTMKKQLISLLLTFLFAGTAASAMQTDTGKYFTSFDGVKIYYEVKGAGYPVVLVHGFTGTSQGWKRGKLYGDLLADGYKVILIDLRGNGRSDKPHTDEAYANNAEAKDIIGLATLLGLKKYDVVGYSRGSIIASSLMLMDKRVNKTVMGGMGDGYTDPEWPRRIHFYKALMGDTSYRETDGLMKWVNSQPFDKLCLALQQKYQPSTSQAELSKVKKPVLIIRGTEDKENGSEITLKKMIPNAQLAYVPGDHNSASGTMQFANAVINFIK
jgi:pimeloyl-ACP methyl ester carboxylesterase